MPVSFLGSSLIVLVLPYLAYPTYLAYLAYPTYLTYVFTSSAAA